MTLDDATLAEAQGDVLQAAELYEQIVSRADAPLLAFLNLTVLYWQATDFGISRALHFPTSFVQRAGHRLPEVIRRGIELHPDSTEIRFWQRYVAWADLGEPLTVSWCEELLHEDPRSLVPALFPFLQGHGHEHDIATLVEQLRSQETARAGYIRSVVEGVEKRRRSKPSPREPIA